MYSREEEKKNIKQKYLRFIPTFFLPAIYNNPKVTSGLIHPCNYLHLAAI
jgi:hypothetical protein